MAFFLMPERLPKTRARSAAVMRGAESAASAANAEFAEGKRRMLDAERAELRRLVRASGR